jgi:hypothetical protein
VDPLVVPDTDTNRSRWPTDPVWRLVQAAPFTDALTKARRLMRREQHVHAVEQLDAGAYGYLISRTALLYPKGATFDVSMGLRGFFEALTRIAASRRGTLASWCDNADASVDCRSPQQGTSYRSYPHGNMTLLPCATLDRLTESVHGGDISSSDLGDVRMRLSERRMVEALHGLEAVNLRFAPEQEIERLEQAYADELATYVAVCRQTV